MTVGLSSVLPFLLLLQPVPRPAASRAKRSSVAKLASLSPAALSI